MTQPRRPVGTPVGGQFAPTNRPEASGVELVDDDAPLHRVEATVGPGIPGFTVDGIHPFDHRETRDRVRAALLSSGLAWPMGQITVRVVEPAPERTADLDLEIALSVLQASGQLPEDADTTGLRGELRLDGSIREEATTDATNLRQLVDSLKATAQPSTGGPTTSERCRELRSAATVIAELTNELGDDVPDRVREAVEDAEELFDSILDELQAHIERRNQVTASDPPLGSRPAPSHPVDADPAGSARTPEAERSWRLFRESYGGWLDQYRTSLQIGGRSETERRLRETAGLAGVDEAQLRADKSRAYKGETSEQILEGR